MLKKSPTPFQPTVLPRPCPKCGAPMLLRHWENRFSAVCQGAGCRYGFDADKRGRALARCPACEDGHLKTTPKGKVCADCGAWDDGMGACPKCRTGRLSLRKGEYGHFAACANLACGLTYTCDEDGRPEGGRCRVCRGPVRKTRSGSRICMACETWQDPKPVPAPRERPPAAACPGCGTVLRAVWTRKARWVHRCTPCGRWVELPG